MNLPQPGDIMTTDTKLTADLRFKKDELDRFMFPRRTA